MTTSDRRLLTFLAVSAFLLRLVVRLRAGHQSILEGGYHLYREIAETFISGGGLCYEPGVRCAVRMPLYSLVLAPFEKAEWIYPGLVVLQAAVGASLVVLAWMIGLELFGRRTAWLAAAAAAFNPYAIIHDTALQETVFTNALAACAMWLLLCAGSRRAPSRDRHHRARALVAAGLVLALVVLTTARLALIVPAAVLWTALAFGPGTDRLRATVAMALPVAVLVGGWAVRNWSIVGAPVLTSESGESFWVANHALTLEFLPERSIDQAKTQAYAALPKARAQSLVSLGRDEVARDRLLARWGWEYVREQPWRVLQGAVGKVWSAVSGQLSPARGPVESWSYRVVFASVQVLALLGWWRVRRDGSQHLLTPLVVAAFVATTAVFWAHTSHKSYLDVPLFVYAASVVTGARSRG